MKFILGGNGTTSPKNGFVSSQPSLDIFTPICSEVVYQPVSHLPWLQIHTDKLQKYIFLDKTFGSSLTDYGSVIDHSVVLGHLWLLMSGDPLRLPLPLVGGLGSRSERDGRRRTDPRDDAGQEPREEQPERLPTAHTHTTTTTMRNSLLLYLS